jgi:hypothetical protein
MLFGNGISEADILKAMGQLIASGSRDVPGLSPIRSLVDTNPDFQFRTASRVKVSRIAFRGRGRSIYYS